MVQIPDNIQPYIDAGWWTVPLGAITRDENGEKQYKFPKNHTCQKEFNDIAGQAGTAFCGAQSGITVLDFDDEALFNLAKKLAPDCKYVACSDIAKKGGHLGFTYTPDLPSKRLRGKLDILNDGSQVFLVSKGNTTKIAEKWSVELNAMPKELIDLVNLLINANHAPVATNNTVIKGTLNTGFKLAPMLENLGDKFYPPLFRIITPKDFRNATYEKQGYIHPSDPSISGRGSEYLSKVAAILASDITVSPELFTKAINYINKMWDEPMSQSRLNSTIINRMINGEATNDAGEPFWSYNPHWELEGIVGTTKQGDTFEVFYEPNEAVFVYVNLTKRDYVTFPDKGKVLTHIQMLTGRKISADDFMSLIKNIQLVTEPTEAYGYFVKDEYEYFNTFNLSQYLAILKEPELLEADYQEPYIILQFLETLIPNETKRTFFLKWLKFKLKTFEYSPLIFLMIGVPGSGKNTLFEDIITPFIGSPYVGTPSVEEFTDKFNGWLLGKYFFFLDEFGELARTKSDHEAIKANLKRFTGSGSNGAISLRLMHKDSYQYSMKGSFIMAANKFPLILDPDDRRLIILETPNILNNQPWVKELGGTGTLKANIKNELIHFAYYLATQVEDITLNEYTTPVVKDDEKLKFLIKTSPLHILIPYLLEQKHFDNLFEFFMEKLPAAKSLDSWHKGYLLVDALNNDYEAISGRDSIHLESEMKGRGFKKMMVTFEGKTQRAYEIFGLKSFDMPQREEVLNVEGIKID